MNTLRSPIRGDAAAARGAAVDRDELAEDVPPADDQARLLAAELEVLRDEADRREREDLGLVADLGPAVDDRTTRRSGSRRPIRHVLADDGVRADDRALADLAPGWTTAVGSIATCVRRRAPSSRSASATTWSRHERHAVRLGQRPPAAGPG